MSDGKLDVRPGGLEVLSTGLNLAELDLHGGEGIWDEVARYSRDSQFEAQADAAMSGRSAPRVWAIMESPGSGPGAAAAGLAIARILADRGQAVVLVDGDEQEPRITRWLGRNEMEGWIDMVRFGASLHAASDSLPSDNRRGSVLGVGSFAPTGVTPDEVADLLARLRRQADDLVLVLPAKLRSQPWFEASHIKLLCWDLLSRSAADTEKIITELDRMGAKPDALIGYGVEEFSAIQDRLREDDQEDGLTPLPPEELDELLAPERMIDPERVAEPILIVEESPGIEPEPEPVTEAMKPVTEATKPVTEATKPVTEAMAATRARLEPPDPAPPSKLRRRSSGIFIFAAVVAAVCLLMLGVFLAGQRGGPDAGDEQTVASARMDARALPPQPGTAAAPATPTAEPTDEIMIDGADADAEVVDEDGEAGDLEGAVVDDAAVDVDPPATDRSEATPPAVVEPAASDAEPVSPAPAEPDLSVFQLPVGQDGWALWLYSFPEQAQAEKEIRELARRGLRAEYRIVDIEGKGRWYRVYVGSFADRNAAKAAVDGLKARLKQDWVVPARM